MQKQVGGFNLSRAEGQIRHAPKWTDFRGKPSQTPATGSPSAEQVQQGAAPPDIHLLQFRDPNYFLAGQLHEHYDEWDKILPKSPEGDMVRGWISRGVNVEDFFTSYSGVFKGARYCSDKPGAFHQRNAAICNQYESFVSATLEEWVVCGAVRVLGAVGKVDPPLVVMPLTVEPSKPRLCHDERYLNLWVRDLPFNPFYADPLKYPQAHVKIHI